MGGAVGEIFHSAPFKILNGIVLMLFLLSSEDVKGPINILIGSILQYFYSISQRRLQKRSSRIRTTVYIKTFDN